MHHKNKYIKLFEDFENDNLFDYTIDDIKNILNKRNINFKDVEYLDSGSYGNAFDLNNGDVLKITTMHSEVFYANKLKNIDSKYLIDVKDTFFHEYYDVGYEVKVGFIVMEKLIMDSDTRFKKFVDFLNFRNSLVDRYEKVSDSDVIEFFKGRMSGLTDREILNHWNTYKRLRLEIDKYNLPTDDLRGKNIGFRNENPVFFDIGDLHKSIKHDYSDIDVIDYLPQKL